MMKLLLKIVVVLYDVVQSSIEEFCRRFLLVFKDFFDGVMYGFIIISYMFSNINQYFIDCMRFIID